MTMSNEIEKAMKVLTKAMKEDTAKGSYASGWHDNIAMAVYDSYGKTTPHREALRISNKAAACFMKRCFNVDTSIQILK
jgi:hypothetical protein